MLENTNKYLNKRGKIIVMLWNLMKGSQEELKDVTLLPGLDGN